MNIILLEKIANLGDIGDTADVKAGFARNFLFPQGKAVPATARNLAEFEERRAELLAAHDEHVRKAQERKDKVEGLALRIEVNASDEGRLYGSVGTRDIAEAVNAEADVAVTKAEVLLPHGVLREVGDYEISLDLGYEVSAEIKLAVVRQGTPAGVTDDGSMIEDMDAAETEADADDAAIGVAAIDIAADETQKESEADETGDTGKEAKDKAKKK